LNSINAHSNKINGDKEKKNFDAFLTTINDHSRIINKNLFNKDAVVLKTKHKMALGTHYKKDQKKRGMESAWTKFIKVLYLYLYINVFFFFFFFKIFFLKI